MALLQNLLRQIKILGWLSLSLAASNLYSQSIIIKNISVVDVAEGKLLSGEKDVIIVKERIQEIAPTGKKRIPKSKSVQIIDGTGKFLIPGLWDMHTHPDDPELWRMDVDSAARDWLMPQFVIHGVTGTRDMAGDLELVKSWKQRITKGQLLGPEIFAAGPLLDGPNPMWDGSLGINDTAHVKFIVDSLRQAGVDFLKVYSLLPRDIYFALAKYAQKVDFPMCGHVPLEVTPAEAAKTGLNSQEHLLEILLACSSEETAIRNNSIDFGETKGLDRYVLKQKQILETYDEQKASKLFQLFVAQNNWHTPTLSMWYKNAYFEQEFEQDKDLYQYLPNYIQKYWTIGVNDHLNYRDHADFIAIKKRLYQKYLELTLDMHKAGVKLLAGTDMGANPLCHPGIGVHNELKEMVKAGLSPAEALKTATIHPSQYLNIESDYGSVDAGKVADMIVLHQNPLENITHTRSIHSVIRRGALIDSKTRRRMLKDISAKMRE